MDSPNATANIYELDARARKILKLSMSIDAALHGWGVDSCSWQAVEIVESMGSPAWGAAASCAGVPMPSETTQAEVREVYRVRALKACGPRVANDEPRYFPDSRPRAPYILPDGTEVRIIFDHGEAQPEKVTFQLRDGTVVFATRKAPDGCDSCNGAGEPVTLHGKSWLCEMCLEHRLDRRAEGR